MYAPHAAAAMGPPQKPETFMLSNEAQQSLPQDAQVALQQVDNLKYFLISAPVDWSQDQFLRRFLLPTGEYVSCVLWNNLFHISGTDIVRCLTFRFHAFGRPVKNPKKFEEGIFSDLRNLKSGTDASLEEPKSAFLDFLYKNNCIRTQKKQKVFYWYSVPHDRLFLDALERDLKREKMGQEATTVAVSEPALSFEFDSTQSLFEQLTKAQQANTSSFSAHAGTPFSQSTSPVMRAIDSMPPPQMIPASLPTVAEEGPADLTELAAAAATPPAHHHHQHHHQPPPHPYHSAALSAMPSALSVSAVKREADYGALYDRHGVPLARPHQRHASMPTYLEYSPAPSFVSSHHEDYSNRGISYEPVTPPQPALPLMHEPAYIAHEETGLYTALPDVTPAMQHAMHGLVQLPPSNFAGAGPPFASAARPFGATNVYQVIEGSPTYKQRRRRSSISSTVAAAAAAAAAAAHSTTTSSGSAAGMGAHAVHRPSDLRRSVSVAPAAEGDASGPNSPPGGTTNGYGLAVASHKEALNLSRHDTPLSTLEGSPVPHAHGLMLPPEDYTSAPHGDAGPDPGYHHPGPGKRPVPGVLRRARSATAMELGPYPQKSHSCPIPTCGRLFKRLEHLKRHVRTHTQERPYHCPFCTKAFSRSDNLAQHRKTHDRDENATDAVGEYNSEEDLEGEEPLATLEEESTESDHAAHAHHHYSQPPPHLHHQQTPPAQPQPQHPYLSGTMASITSMPGPSTSTMGMTGLAAPSQLMTSHRTMIPQSI